MAAGTSSPRPRSRNRALLRRLLDDAAADWGTSRVTVGLIAIGPVLVVLTGCFTALMGKPAYKWFVSEDGFAENLQVIVFALSAVAAVVVGLRLRRDGARWLGAMLVFCGVALVWVTGEEVSWGQRIADLDTPQVLAEVNRQGEMNLHNIYAVEKALRLGQFLVGLWATVLPFVVLRYRRRLKRWAREVSVLVPHYALVLYFAGTMVWRAYRELGPRPPESLAFVVSEWSEVIELNLALGITFHMLYLLQRTRPKASQPGLAGESRP